MTVQASRKLVCDYRGCDTEVPAGGVGLPSATKGWLVFNSVEELGANESVADRYGHRHLCPSHAITFLTDYFAIDYDIEY